MFITRLTKIFWIFLIILWGFFNQEALAGTIVSFNAPPSGPGLGAANIAGLQLPPPRPNNDNANPSQNSFSINKRFDRSEVIDMVFTVENSNGTTEYFINDDRALNNTQNTWTDFVAQLGFGVGANFVLSGLSDFLDFDVGTTNNMEDATKDKDPRPTSNAFPNAGLSHQANSITWSATRAMPSVVRPGSTVASTFSIDIPDLSNAIPPSARLPTGYQFTLRELPSVGLPKAPEPATLALFCIGLLSMIVYLRTYNSKVRAVDLINPMVSRRA